MSEPCLRFAFAGDRDVAVEVLRILLEGGDQPLALLLSDEGSASHDRELMALCGGGGTSPPVLRGARLHAPESVALLRGLDLDYIVCVHFPYIVKRPILESARYGVLNLHPAYLPFNRGWHTPTWAILDGTPAGATLHYMTEQLDAGDIVEQEQLPVGPADTAHSLYERLKRAEVDVFRRGWRRIRSGCRTGRPQEETGATMHRRSALFDPAVQRIDLQACVPAGELLTRLRALTTSRLDEAAYFECGSRRYRVQVTITPEVPA